LGVFEPFRLRRPVVLESAVLLAGPLHAEAEGRKRQRLGKGRNQRQSEPRLDTRLFISEQRRQPLDRQRLPANLVLAEAAIAVDAIQCANDRVEQGETRFRITWLGCNSQQRRLDWSSKPDEPLAVSRETAVLEQRGNALKHFRSCFILRRT